MHIINITLLLLNIHNFSNSAMTAAHEVQWKN